MPTLTGPRPLLGVVGFIVCIIIVLLMLLGVATTLPAWLPYILLAAVFACLIW